MQENHSLPQFYAHTLDGASKDKWEPLFTPWHNQPGKDLPENPAIACSGKNGESCQHCEDLQPNHGHLNKVAYLCSNFAAKMLPEGPDRKILRQWGFVTGIWHDLGKFSKEFQTYISQSCDPHSGEIQGKVDHTSAGAKLATNISPLGHTIATAIAGHHAGLLDARGVGASLEKRLNKDIPDIDAAPSDILAVNLPNPPSFLNNLHPQFSLSFFQRMIFSCLVDADFLATEAFMNAQQAKHRPTEKTAVFSHALRILEKKIADFGPPTTPVNIARTSVLNDCLAAAESPEGFFSLTVPTGGGKTLSSLAFALKHAVKHGHNRIIYVIPFTSIIEQNAGVFKDLLSELGDDIILEHHSNLSPDKETTHTRLAAENWDAPIVVTTAVQFYESLFASKTSKTRKLHNIANSIVILDEAQALPVQYLSPCLRALEQLTTNYHTTTVLCTATQPAVQKTPEFPIGLANIQEIISNTQALFASLKRVNITYRGTLEDPTIASEISATSQVLCIVNTRNHAQTLYKLLPINDENYHLSALMCPEHRIDVLNTVRARLEKGLPTRLISTQLIEAGVDIDFPTVYRSMAGLDSISQSAGRCNRNGKLPSGEVHVFHSEHIDSEIYFRDTANVGHEILDLHKTDPLSTEAINAYFDKYYYQQESQWDAKNILNEFKLVQDRALPLLFQYKTAAKNFKLIENQQIPIIIPWDEKAKKLCNDLRNLSIPINRNLLRALQRYTVQIYPNQFNKNKHQFQALRDDEFHILICPETHYSDTFGLNLTDEAANSAFLNC